MQEFEKNKDLAAHIERMASTGITGSPIEWSEFLTALNEAIHQTRIKAHMAGQADSGIDPSFFNARIFEVDYD